MLDENHCKWVKDNPKLVESITENIYGVKTLPPPKAWLMVSYK